MVLLDKMWDDVIAGPHPDRGLGKLRKVTTKPLIIKDSEAGESSAAGKYQRSLSMPQSPVTPTTPSSAPKANVWRSVFNPGSNLATKNLGSDMFDKPLPNSPTIYDWMYSGETRSTHR